MKPTTKPLISRIPAIEVSPVVENATFAAKATEGEAFPIQATVFREGHDRYGADAVLITPDGQVHSRTRMYDVSPGNDRLEAWVAANRTGKWAFRIETWSDPWGTWKHAAAVKIEAGQDVEIMTQEGANLLERAARGTFLPAPNPPQSPPYRASQPDESAKRELLLAAKALRNSTEDALTRYSAATSSRIDKIMEQYPLRDFIESTAHYPIQVDRKAALYGSWYQVFPRSFGAKQKADGTWKSGTLSALTNVVADIAQQGYTVLYLTPIHPIGTTLRKGRNNTLTAEDGDPGSPYGIGGEAGGHEAIHPDLGDFADFRALVEEARNNGMEVALDLALQASPDHPWVKNHPEWFTTRVDGSIAYAENPPKKYQDIYPLNFDQDPEGLYEAIVELVELWIEQGVTLFRVDNPHTKPLPFWERFLAYMRSAHPQIIFLAEAFTRPAMMRTLGMIGFQQSYTYFAWRVTKHELTDYFTEVSKTTPFLMRPSFWPITHDILTPQMVTGGEEIFQIRAVLAATGSPTYGIYSGYELTENVQRPGFEEQIDNEKYEYKPRLVADLTQSRTGKLLKTLNHIRATHPALQQLHSISFHHTTNDKVICYSKHVPAQFSATGEADTIIVVVSLDPHHEVESTIYLDEGGLFEPSTRSRLGQNSQAPPKVPLKLDLTDLLDQRTYSWGRENYVRFSPATRLAHVFHVTQSH